MSTKLDTINDKLDRLLDTLSDEVNAHPDILRDDAFMSGYANLGFNTAHTYQFTLTVSKRGDQGTWMVLLIRDPFGQPIFHKELRCVYRDWNTQQIVAQ